MNVELIMPRHISLGCILTTTIISFKRLTYTVYAPSKTMWFYGSLIEADPERKGDMYIALLTREVENA